MGGQAAWPLKLRQYQGRSTRVRSATLYRRERKFGCKVVVAALVHEGDDGW